MKVTIHPNAVDMEAECEAEFHQLRAVRNQASEFRHIPFDYVDPFRLVIYRHDNETKDRGKHDP